MILDSDNDGMPNWWENQYHLHPGATTAPTHFLQPDRDDANQNCELNSHNDLIGYQDLPYDDLTNLWEYRLNLNPIKADTDENGINDDDEDTDGDGYSNYWEIQHNLDPSTLCDDFDGDGLMNYQESSLTHTNLLMADSDGDGISDYVEIMNFHSDPNDRTNPYRSGINLTEYCLGNSNHFSSQTIVDENSKIFRAHDISVMSLNYTWSTYADPLVASYTTFIEDLEEDGTFSGNAAFNCYSVFSANFLKENDWNDNYDYGGAPRSLAIDKVALEMEVLCNGESFNVPLYLSSGSRMSIDQGSPENSIASDILGFVLDGALCWANPYVGLTCVILDASDVICQWFSSGETVSYAPLENNIGFKWSYDFASIGLFSSGSQGDNDISFMINYDFDFLKNNNMFLDDGDVLTFNLKYSIVPHLNHYILGYVTIGETVTDKIDFFESFDIVYHAPSN